MSLSSRWKADDNAVRFVKPESSTKENILNKGCSNKKNKSTLYNVASKALQGLKERF